MEGKKLQQNGGSAVVEATLILPLFIFFVLSLYHMGQSKIAESVIYEAAIETAEYMAEYAYMDDNNVLLPELRFAGYVDNEDLIKRYIEGGVNGVSFLGTIPLNSEGEVVLKVSYAVYISVPFFPGLKQEHTVTIRQKGYVGAGYGNQTVPGQGDETYVYITDNRDVYHCSRGCTYLQLSVCKVRMDTARDEGYTACAFCGKTAEGYVYITDYGNRYHARKDCSGLKRTVYRVALSTLGGLAGCSRCAR